jgi:hypothetical protein
VQFVREKENTMFRFALVFLAAFGLASLLFGESGAGVGLGFLVLFPLFVLVKVMFIAMLFGYFGHRARRGGDPGWGGPAGWRRPEWRRDREDTGSPSAEDRFEEWHRMAHAREEVDSWVSEEGPHPAE